MTRPYDFDDLDDPGSPLGPARPPGIVRVAGIIWTVVGALGIIEALAHLMVNVIALLGNESPFSRQNYVGCGCGTLFAFLFLGLGLLTASGRASRGWIIAISILSLLFSLACGCTGLLAWGMSHHAVAGEQGAVYLVAALDEIQALALLIAAILALVGQKEYARWQRNHV